MLKFNFTRIFKAKGIERPYTFLVKAGYSASFSTRVTNNKVRQLNLVDVENLCAMLKCTPNDLLEWVPDQNDKSAGEGHPLSSLQRISNNSHINQILYNIPFDRLADIEKMILKEVGK
jgi:DNA-binding Xre family transcriptional regulator